MSISRPKAAPSDYSPSDLPKIRQCLRCEAAFPSEWSGERICARCKRSAAWCTGVLLRPGLSGARR
jgi:hypothetical protein